MENIQNNNEGLTASSLILSASRASSLLSTLLSPAPPTVCEKRHPRVEQKSVNVLNFGGLHLRLIITINNKKLTAGKKRCNKESFPKQSQTGERDMDRERAQKLETRRLNGRKILEKTCDCLEFGHLICLFSLR